MQTTVTKHTPGPWEAGDNGTVNVKTGSFIHPSEPRLPTPAELEELGDECHDDWRICDCTDSMCARPYGECLANARLIASAPKLLEALTRLAAIAGKERGSDQEMDDWQANFDEMTDALLLAEVAICEATGTEVKF